MTTPLTDAKNVELRDVAKHGDVLKDPAYRQLLGIPKAGASRTVVRDLVATELAKLLRHLPGEHNQQSHGNGHNSLGAIEHLEVFDADEYEDAFGDVQHEAGGDASGGVVPRYFESGEMHLAFDMDDDHHQVMGEIDADQMRALSKTINEALAIDVDDFDEEDEDADGIIATLPGPGGFNVHRYSSGDLRIDAPDAPTGYMDLSEEQADELQAALEDVADNWDEDFEKVDQTTDSEIPTGDGNHD